MLVVTVVLVSPSSVVAVMCEGADSDWKIVEPQSFSFSKKRRSCVDNQEDVSH